MYTRFSERAHKVMQFANQEAQRCNHEFIGTEHILLGLVKEGSGVAAYVLKSLDIDLCTIQQEVERIVKPGPQWMTTEKLLQIPRAKKVIEYAIDEARKVNNEIIGTEHLLLGLLRETQGVAAQILIKLGLELTEVRFVLQSLSVRHTDTGQIFITTYLRPEVREVMKEYEAQIELLRREKELAVADGEFERAASLRDQADDLKKQRVAIIRAAQGQ